MDRSKHWEDLRKKSRGVGKALHSILAIRTKNPPHVCSPKRSADKTLLKFVDKDMAGSQGTNFAFVRVWKASRRYRMGSTGRYGEYEGPVRTYNTIVAVFIFPDFERYVV